VVSALCFSCLHVTATCLLDSTSWRSRQDSTAVCVAGTVPGRGKDQELVEELNTKLEEQERKPEEQDKKQELLVLLDR